MMMGEAVFEVTAEVQLMNMWSLIWPPLQSQKAAQAPIAQQPEHQPAVLAFLLTTHDYTMRDT